MKAHRSRIRKRLLPISQAKGFLKNDLSVFLDQDCAAEVRGLRVGPDVGLDCCRIDPILRQTWTGTQSRDAKQYQGGDLHFTFPVDCSSCSIAFSASRARCAACPEAAGKPPMAFSRSSLLTARASASVCPRTISVSNEPHAIAGTQPLARKRTSTSLPSPTLALSFNTSPQAGFSTCTDASAPATSPGLRGCSKWSRTSAEYIASIVDERPQSEIMHLMPDHSPQRIVSLQPSATVILAAIGALERVVACTKYCVDVCPEVQNSGRIIVSDSWTA